MRPAANQISDLSSPGSIRLQVDWLWCVSESIQPREEANSWDSVETEVIEAQSSLPPLFAVQSHSLSQNILLLSNQWSLPDRLLKTISPPPLILSLFLPLPLSILIANRGDETGFTCKVIPNGSFGCCWVVVSWCKGWIQAYRRGLKGLLQRELQPRTHGLYSSPSPRLSPRPRERGVCRLFQGAGLMGKSWQDDQGKLTPSSSCFMKVWQMCREQRKGAAEEGKIELYSKRRDRRMKSAPSSKVSVRPYLCPLPHLAFVSQHG